MFLRQILFTSLFLWLAGVSSVAAVTIGDLLITEVMSNPQAVDDDQGEWFELYNASSATINLNGMRVTSASNTGFTIGADLFVAPGAYAVIANNASLGNTQYGVTADVVYPFSAFSLSAQQDSITIYSDATESVVVSTLQYSSTGGQGWPTQSSNGGASIQLDPTLLKATYVNTGSAWCLSSQSLATGTDRGTPRAANSDCTSIDLDSDGFWEAEECDDQNASLAEWAEYFFDADGDGYGSSESQASCKGVVPAGYVSAATDCQDDDAAISPGVVEICDGVDNNCDAQIDEGVTTTLYEDADGDGLGNPNAPLTQCVASANGYVNNANDVNDQQHDTPADDAKQVTEENEQSTPGTRIDLPSPKKLKAISPKKRGRVTLRYSHGETYTVSIFPATQGTPLVQRYNQRLFAVLHPKGKSVVLFDLKKGMVTDRETITSGRFSENRILLREVSAKNKGKEVVALSQSSQRLRISIVRVQTKKQRLQMLYRSLSYRVDEETVLEETSIPAIDQKNKIPTENVQK